MDTRTLKEKEAEFWKTNDDTLWAQLKKVFNEQKNSRLELKKLDYSVIYIGPTALSNPSFSLTPPFRGTAPGETTSAPNQLQVFINCFNEAAGLIIFKQVNENKFEFSVVNFAEYAIEKANSNDIPKIISDLVDKALANFNKPINQKVPLSKANETPIARTIEKPLVEEPLSEKAQALMAEANNIAPNSPAAYAFIRKCFLDYSKANPGVFVFAAFARLMHGHINHHGSKIAEIILKPEYAVFDEKTLKQFYAEFKGRLNGEPIKPNGDVQSFITVSRRLTNVDFNAVQPTYRLGYGYY